MGKNIPPALAERQELQRQETINKVLHAIQYLMDNGADVGITELVHLTGLSRSVFAKPHVQKVLDEHYESYYETMEEMAEKTKRMERTERKAEKKKNKIKNHNERVKRLTEENTSLKEECELLRGRLFLLMQRLQV